MRMKTITRWAVVGMVCSVPFACGAEEGLDAAGESASVLAKAIVNTQGDIESDTAELNALRDRIAEERRPMAARLDALQKTVKELRADAERMRRLRNQGEKEQAALESDAAALDEERLFLAALFSEYARSMETRVSAGEAMRLSERLRPLQAALAEEGAHDGFADSIGRLLMLAESFNSERLGGSIIEGVALDHSGIECQGRFAAFGPLVFFAAADDGGPAGLAVTQFGAHQSAVYDRFSKDVKSAIRDLVSGGAVRVPVDVSGGDALKIEEAGVSLMAHIRKGGFVMVPLLAVALSALVLTVWKTIGLTRIRVDAGDDMASVIRLVKQGMLEEARRKMAVIKQPLLSLVEEAVEHHASPRDHLEEIMHEHVLMALPDLERHLGTLAVLGGIAPLLGLLGTVTGMIHTFQLVTIFGSGDAKLLSGGISEALVTTEAGLVIAIPVLLAHAFLARRARSIIGGLERTAVSMVNDIKVRGADV